MRTLFRCLGILLACSLLAGCFTWGPTTKTKPATTAGATTAFAPTTVKNVALLLPLEGPLGNAGQAIRDGFVTAYNSDSSSNKPAHITIIDTYNQSILEAYNKAIKADADMIVGPLAKNNVQALVQANAIAVPTLALNYLDSNVSAPAKLYQFGLSPLDEARQAAALAHQNGGKNAVIIAPHNSWGQTLAQTYENEWQALGGNVVAKLYFSEDSTELNNQIKNLVNAHKQKFDVILLAASPQMARQIKPLLKFYYAGDVPVYATSLVYTGTPQPAYDTDLNGITFCDMPWILTTDSAALKLRQQIALFWAVNFKQNARLYALGIDAYQLVEKLPQLINNQQTITGTTGNLFLNNQHLIVRQLTCAQFNRGVPEVLTSNTVANNPPAKTEATAASHDDGDDDSDDNANLASAMNVIDNAADQTDEQN